MKIYDWMYKDQGKNMQQKSQSFPMLWTKLFWEVENFQIDIFALHKIL